MFSAFTIRLTVRHFTLRALPRFIATVITNLYPRLIPALVSSGVSPFTLIHHTSALHLWHRCLYEEHFQRLAWLLHIQFVQLDAVCDPGSSQHHSP